MSKSRFLPVLLSALFLACSGEPSAPDAPPPAAAFRLLDQVVGLAADPGEVVFLDDLTGVGAESGGSAPPGWVAFPRPDRTTAAGEEVVSLVRAVETLGGDIDFRARVDAGPVFLRVARLPEAAGPIPEPPEQLRAWLRAQAQAGDAREVGVAEDGAGTYEAALTWPTERAEVPSSRILVALDLVVGRSAVGRVELARRPSFEVQYESAVYATPAYLSEPVRGRVNLAGDHREALVVPAGASVRVPFAADPHLAERRTLELALGALAGIEPAELVPVRARLELVDGADVLLVEELELDPGARPSEQAWQDLSLDLTGLTLAPSAELRLTVEAGAAVAGRQQRPALALAHPRLVGGTSERARPNLILVSLDTLRADRVGPGPDGRSLTPNLDAFAERALVFTQAQSAAPFTLPSHGSIFTGLLPTAHGGVDVETPMRTGATSLTELLSLAGWTTTAFTGGGFMSPDFGFARGFDRYTIHDPLITTETLPALEELGLDLSDASALARADWESYLRLEAAWRLKLPALEAWSRGAAAAPFFLFVHTYAAHQYHPPRRIYDAELAGTESAWTFGRKLPTLSPAAFAADPPSAADQEHLRRLYDACVLHADEEFGAVLALLEDRELLASSYVVVFSDHGEELFEHGDFGHSNSLRDELLHVPLMIAGPGIEAGQVDRPVSLLDLPPTLCKLLDLPVDPVFQGTSLVRGNRTSFGPAEDVSPVFSEVSHHEFHRDALRLDGWKLVRDYGPGGRGRGPAPVERLFDMASEAGEFADRAAEQPELVQRLAEQLAARRAAADAAAAGLPEERSGVSAATKDQLGDLGYL